MEENQAKEFQKLSSYTELTKNHGRMEKQEYYTWSKTEEIQRILDKKWVQVGCIGMARLTRMIGKTTSVEVHDHLLDQETSAEMYGKLARNHWKIENSLHWVLDVHFCADASTANSGNAIANLTLLRKIAYNFTKIDIGMKKRVPSKK